MRYARGAGRYGNQNPYDRYKAREQVDQYQENLKKSILQDELSGPSPFFNRAEIMYKDHLMNNFENQKAETGKLDEVIEQSLDNRIDDYAVSTGKSEVSEDSYQEMKGDAIKEGQKWTEIIDDPLAVDDSILELNKQLDNLNAEMYDEHLDTQEFIQNIDEVLDRRRIDDSEVSL